MSFRKFREFIMFFFYLVSSFQNEISVLPVKDKLGLVEYLTTNGWEYKSCIKHGINKRGFERKIEEEEISEPEII